MLPQVQIFHLMWVILSDSAYNIQLFVDYFYLTSLSISRTLANSFKYLDGSLDELPGYDVLVLEGFSLDVDFSQKSDLLVELWIDRFYKYLVKLTLPPLLHVGFLYCIDFHLSAFRRLGQTDPIQLPVVEQRLSIVFDRRDLGLLYGLLRLLCVILSFHFPAPEIPQQISNLKRSLAVCVDALPCVYGGGKCRSLRDRPFSRGEDDLGRGRGSSIEPRALLSSSNIIVRVDDMPANIALGGVRHDKFIKDQQCFMFVNLSGFWTASSRRVLYLMCPGKLLILELKMYSTLYFLRKQLERILMGLEQGLLISVHRLLRSEMELILRLRERTQPRKSENITQGNFDIILLVSYLFCYIKLMIAFPKFLGMFLVSFLEQRADR